MSGVRTDKSVLYTSDSLFLSCYVFEDIVNLGYATVGFTLVS